VERLTRAHGLVGVRRGKRVRTTIPGDGVRSHDVFARQFDPPVPDRLRVADFTYVATWSGMDYVAFVIDAYSRRILGWRAATTMRTSLVLDALEQAAWTRGQQGRDRSLPSTPAPPGAGRLEPVALRTPRDVHARSFLPRRRSR
jgi:putative transposase